MPSEEVTVSETGSEESGSVNQVENERLKSVEAGNSSARKGKKLSKKSDFGMDIVVERSRF